MEKATRKAALIDPNGIRRFYAALFNASTARPIFC
jgi:hypothetical protein